MHVNALKFFLTLFCAFCTFVFWICSVIVLCILTVIEFIKAQHSQSNYRTYSKYVRNVVITCTKHVQNHSKTFKNMCAELRNIYKTLQSVFRTLTKLSWNTYKTLSRRKRLAAICSGRTPRACLRCVRHVSAYVRLVSALCPAWCPACCSLWVRLGPFAALCPPCVRLESALAAPPKLVRHPCVVFVCTGPPCRCSRPCLWILSALGLLWGRAVASPSYPPLRSPCVYIACPLVSFLGVHSGFPSASYAWKTVWGLCWCSEIFFVCAATYDHNDDLFWTYMCSRCCIEHC